MEAQLHALSARKSAGDGVTIFCRHQVQPALFVRRRIPLHNLAEGVRTAFDELTACLRKQRASALGAAFIACHDLTAHDVDIEVGAPVSEETRGNDTVKRAHLPLGRYLSVAQPLTGSALEYGYRSLRSWLEQHDEHAYGPVYTLLEELRPPDDTPPVAVIQRRISAGRARVSSDALAVDSALLSDAAAQLTRDAVEALRAAARTPPSRLPSASATASRLLSAVFTGKDARVRSVMSRPVLTCQRSERLSSAAQRMWEHDIGALPVLDHAGLPIAMITDRDICMAAYTQGKPLSEIRIESAMSTDLYACGPEDTVLTAEKIMAQHEVRRLPVVAADGALLGIISLNDVVLARTQTLLRSLKERLLGDVTRTIAAISRHRGGEDGQERARA